MQIGQYILLNLKVVHSIWYFRNIY